MKNNPIRSGTGKLITSEDQRPHQQPFITWHIHQLRSIFLHNKNRRTILLSEGGATARYSSAIGRRLLCEPDIGAPWWGTSRFPKCIRRREEAAGGCTSVSYLQVVLTWTLKRGRGTQLEYKNHRASCTHWSETTDKTSPKMKNEATSELQEPAGM